MSSNVPADMINLRLILVSGKTKEFLFSPNDSASDIAKHVYDNWPMDWEEEQVSSPNILRLIYQGRFLHGNVTLGARLCPERMRTALSWMTKTKTGVKVWPLTSSPEIRAVRAKALGICKSQASSEPGSKGPKRSGASSLSQNLQLSGFHGRWWKGKRSIKNIQVPFKPPASQGRTSVCSFTISPRMTSGQTQRQGAGDWTLPRGSKDELQTDDALCFKSQAWPLVAGCTGGCALYQGKEVRAVAQVRESSCVQPWIFDSEMSWVPKRQELRRSLA
uniref:Ubiquitin-like protein 3 n=1 Tax=Sus scrofa TaxID=9823 RepID=A0A8D1W3F9_PIG